MHEQGSGRLPVSGVIPDMFSDSERYIQLQNVYREKAAEDAEWVHRRVQELLEKVGKPAVSDVHSNSSSTSCVGSAIVST